MSKALSRSTACLLTALPLAVAVSVATAGPLPDPIFADGFDGAPPRPGGGVNGGDYMCH
jgi:hypothetical protein